MKISALAAVSALSLTLFTASAFAQSPAPAAAPAAPAAKTAPMAPAAPMAKTTKAAPAAKSSDDKTAVSKACSDQATAKGLHGKERKKFRATCKKNDGKAT